MAFIEWMTNARTMRFENPDHDTTRTDGMVDNALLLNSLFIRFSGFERFNFISNASLLTHNGSASYS